MEAVRQYIISVSAAAVFCGVTKTLIPKGSAQALISILCGTFLAYTFLLPFRDINLDSLVGPVNVGTSFDSYEVQEGRAVRRDTIAQIVINNTEALIMDKANEYGVTVYAEVMLSEDEIPIPISVSITGTISPYVKKQIQSYIRDELGIAEENQLWTG